MGEGQIILAEQKGLKSMLKSNHPLGENRCCYVSGGSRDRTDYFHASLHGYLNNKGVLGTDTALSTVECASFISQMATN